MKSDKTKTEVLRSSAEKVLADAKKNCLAKATEALVAVIASIGEDPNIEEEYYVCSSLIREAADTITVNSACSQFLEFCAAAVTEHSTNP